MTPRRTPLPELCWPALAALLRPGSPLHAHGASSCAHQAVGRVCRLRESVCGDARCARWGQAPAKLDAQQALAQRQALSKAKAKPVHGAPQAAAPAQCFAPCFADARLRVVTTCQICISERAARHTSACSVAAACEQRRRRRRARPAAGHAPLARGWPGWARDAGFPSVSLVWHMSSRPCRGRAGGAPPAAGAAGPPCAPGPPDGEPRLMAFHLATAVEIEAAVAQVRAAAPWLCTALYIGCGSRSKMRSALPCPGAHSKHTWR